jgi:hypothetical protein
MDDVRLCEMDESSGVVGSVGNLMGNELVVDLVGEKKEESVKESLGSRVVMCSWLMVVGTRRVGVWGRG